MTGWRRTLVWAVPITAGVALMGLAAYFIAIGLDDAGKWSEVIGAFAGLAGLVATGYGVVLTRRSLHAATPAPAADPDVVRQRVEADGTVYTAARDQRFGARTGGAPDRAGPGRRRTVEQEVRAAKDAYVAGRDQHFGDRRPQ